MIYRLINNHLHVWNPIQILLFRPLLHYQWHLILILHQNKLYSLKFFNLMFLLNFHVNIPHHQIWIIIFLNIPFVVYVLYFYIFNLFIFKNNIDYLIKLNYVLAFFKIFVNVKLSLITLFYVSDYDQLSLNF